MNVRFLGEAEGGVWIKKSINPSRPDPGRREKITKILNFTLLCGASKSFMKAFKAFIKPFEAPQRSMKIKLIFILIQLCEIHGVGRVKPQGGSLLI